MKKIRIMARSIQDAKKIVDFGIPNKNITQCKNLHAKFIIKDKKVLLVSSCNITLGALGDNKNRPGSYEASIVTEDEDSVDKARILFEGIWSEKSEKDMPELKSESPFISSVNGIPSRIEKLIKEAKKEIVIAIPPLFGKVREGYESIGEYIRELNTKVNLHIYTSYSIAKDNWAGYERIKGTGIKLTLVPELLHAKIYLFDDKIACISSLNASYASWLEAVEVGLLTEDGGCIEKIKKVLSTFKTVDSPEKKESTGKGDKGDEIDDENIRRIKVKFKNDAKRTNLRGRLKKDPIKPPKSRKTSSGGGKPEQSPQGIKSFPFKPTRGCLVLQIEQNEKSISTFSVPVDRRRKSSHEVNKDNLLKGIKKGIQVPAPQIKTCYGFKEGKGFSYQEVQAILQRFSKEGFITIKVHCINYKKNDIRKNQ